MIMSNFLDDVCYGIESKYVMVVVVLDRIYNCVIYYISSDTSSAVWKAIAAFQSDTNFSFLGGVLHSDDFDGVAQIVQM